MGELDGWVVVGAEGSEVPAALAAASRVLVAGDEADSDLRSALSESASLVVLAAGPLPPNLRRDAVVGPDERAAWFDHLADAVLHHPEVVLLARRDEDHPARWDHQALARGARVTQEGPGGLPLSLDRVEALLRVDAARSHLLARPDAAVDLPDELRDLVIVEDGTPRLSHLVEVIERSAFEQPSIRPYAAMARVIRAMGRQGSAEFADDLEGCVRWWVDQRLWSLNLVPELVAHDDRHVERVDHLASQLVAPLLGAPRGPFAADELTPRDLLVLSGAAWLHDWGHVGGCLPGSSVQIEDPILVRHFHGLLSQHRLSKPALAPMHRLPEELARRVGVLCGHHQGWTSFGAEHYRDPTKQPKAPVVEFRRLRDGSQPNSFDTDVWWSMKAKPGSPAHAKERALLALLRVADAADVGIHRVPDNASRREFEELRLDRYRTQTKVLLAGAELDEQLRNAIIDNLDLVEVDESMDDGALAALRQQVPRGAALDAILRLETYVASLRQSPQHQRRHELVRSVSFELAPRPKGGFTFSARVLVDAGHEALAEDAEDGVRSFIADELERSSTDGATIGDLLESVGLHFAD